MSQSPIIKLKSDSTVLGSWISRVDQILSQIPSQIPIADRPEYFMRASFEKA